MSEQKPEHTAARKSEIRELAHEIASQVAWDMGLSGKMLSNDFVVELEQQTYDRLIATL
jgi:hypothetical protein